MGVHLMYRRTTSISHASYTLIYARARELIGLRNKIPMYGKPHWMHGMVWKPAHKKIPLPLYEAYVP